MSKLSAKPIYGDPNRRRPADLAKRRLNVIASATLWKAPQRMRVRVIAAKNGSKPVERRRSGRRKGEAIRKNTVIIIALVCIFGGAPASLAGQSRRDCEAPGHFPRTCHCHSKHGDFVRYRARLIGPFESEYDVEKWEQALRQGQQRQPSENSRLEGSHSSNGWHFDHRRHLRWPTAPRRRVQAR